MSLKSEEVTSDCKAWEPASSTSVRSTHEASDTFVLSLFPHRPLVASL